MQGILDDAASLKAAPEDWRDSFVRLAKRAPPRSEAENIAQRFRAHGRTYIRFITTPECKPRNNLSEQAHRFVVIGRRSRREPAVPADSGRAREPEPPRPRAPSKVDQCSRSSALPSRRTSTARTLRPCYARGIEHTAAMDPDALKIP